MRNCSSSIETCFRNTEIWSNDLKILGAKWKSKRLLWKSLKVNQL